MLDLLGRSGPSYPIRFYFLKDVSRVWVVEKRGLVKNCSEGDLAQDREVQSEAIRSPLKFVAMSLK